MSSRELEPNKYINLWTLFTEVNANRENLGWIHLHRGKDGQAWINNGNLTASERIEWFLTLTLKRRKTLSGCPIVDKDCLTKAVHIQVYEISRHPVWSRYYPAEYLRGYEYLLILSVCKMVRKGGHLVNFGDQIKNL